MAQKRGFSRGYNRRCLRRGSGRLMKKFKTKSGRVSCVFFMPGYYQIFWCVSPVIRGMENIQDPGAPF